MALFKYKGNRIRASDQHLVYRFCMGTLILLFLCIVVLLNLKQIVHTDWENFNLTKMEFSLSSYNFITLLIAAGVCALVAFLYYRFCYDSFKKMVHRQKLARMILENKWYEAEQAKQSGFFTDLPSSTKETITWLPKIYYQMKNGLLHIRCEISMGKYQEQLLNLEDKLESGLYCEMTDKVLHDGYIEYTIMTRAGITLIVTVAFSISSMFYNISTDYPFFMIAFLQIVCFAGIYMKLGDLMNMFSLNASDSQGVARGIFHRPYMFMRHRARRMERRMTRAASLGVAAGTGAMAGSMAGKQNAQASEQRSRNNVSKGSFRDVPKKAGAMVGAVMDTKNKMKEKAGAVRENIKDMPIQASYAVHSVGRQAKESVSDFKRGIVQEREHRQSGREEKRQQHRQTIADKRMALQKIQEQSGNRKTHERPAAVSKENLSENRSKVQEVRRPIRSAGTPIRKEPQKVTVETMEKTRPLSSYEKNSRNKNDVENVRSTKSQSVQTVQKSQVHKETNRKVVSKKGQKKK